MQGTMLEDLEGNSMPVSATELEVNYDMIFVSPNPR